MILVDTSVWVEHFRVGNEALARLLDKHQVWIHPFVIGEIACCNLGNHEEILSRLGHLPAVPAATHSEALFFMERNRLAGLGIGYIDLHLLASASLAPPMRLWTRDRRLGTVADGMGCAYRKETEIM